MRYYALQHGHFSDPYSVRVALDGTAEPRYKDQGSGTCVDAGVAAAAGTWVARPRGRWCGHRSHARSRQWAQRLQPDRMNGTAPNGTNAQRRDATPTEVRNRAAWRPPGRPGPPGGNIRISLISAHPRPPGPARGHGRIAKSAKVRSRNTASRAAAGCIPERSAVFALRLRCARCACGLYVLRTPLPPSPGVFSMPNIEHAMPAGAFVESCVSASARRSSVGG